MVTGRIIAMSDDAGFASKLEAALAKTGLTVELHAGLSSIGDRDVDASLCVIHFNGGGLRDGHSLLRRLNGNCRVIAILPRDEVGSIVELMGTSERIVAMLVEEDLEPRRLLATANRILTSDVFGLAKQMMEGTAIHEILLSDYEGRGRCMATIGEFLVLVRVPERHHAAIEQCIDEMLMNAIYDAPVDSAGNHIFAGIPPRTRVSLDIDQTVVVQYAFDGTQFGVSVRDTFGSLERRTVLSFLHKSMHASQQIDQKEGGAGVGLYLMMNAATTVSFNVVPKLATEVLCTFDLASSREQLDQLNLVVEGVDVSGLLSTPARVPPGQPRTRVSAMIPAAPARTQYGPTVVLGVAIAIAVVGVLSVRAYRRATHKTSDVTIATMPGATIEVEGKSAGIAANGALSLDGLELGHAYTITATLAGHQPGKIVIQPHEGPNVVKLELVPLAAALVLQTEPLGTIVEIAGKVIGETPVTANDLVPRSDVEIKFRRVGYREVIAHLKAPGPGEHRTFTQKLEVSAETIRVHFTSNPPGARIVHLPETTDASKTYTPADVYVDAGTEQRFELTMPEHAPLVIDPFTAKVGSAPLEKGGTLKPSP